jgi:molybdopterin molybdotransferase
MPEFLTLLPPPEARLALFSAIPNAPQPPTETIDSASALGRVAAFPVTAAHPLPAFPRTTVDGYAVQAADTFGASESLPAYLQLIGEVPMGAAPTFSVKKGQAALIHTGGMLPEGADAVIMLEHTQRVESAITEIEALRAVAVGENILTVGEDVAEGQVVIPAGTRLRSAEIGGMMALGQVTVSVARRPRVALLSSGDEVIPPEQTPQPGQVRDVNAAALAALVMQAGGEPVQYGIVPDDDAKLEETARKAISECDVVVISAGSSASTRDMTSEIIARLGAPGVLVHGVNVRPGKPTILGVCNGKPVIGLPGNPVSALVIAGLFVVPVIEKLLGLKTARPRPSIPATLALNIPSQAGREDWIAVRLVETESGYGAEPVFAKSNLIFSLAAADGLIRIPPEVTGLTAGAQVQVELI